MTSEKELQKIINLGEGQTVEFKEVISKLDKEIIAFANASGGSIYCGINDQGKILGLNISNSLISQIQDIARNCDPSVNLSIKKIGNNILQIYVPEGDEKPYQCSGGFYLRIGANSQKLKTGDIKKIISGKSHFFDSQVHILEKFDKIFDQNAFAEYCQLLGVGKVSKADTLLENLGALLQVNQRAYLNNAGILLFTKIPSKFIPESRVILAKYSGSDKFGILKRQELSGPLISQIENSIQFVKENINISYNFTGAARREEVYEYSLVAIREAVVNAIVHRDYSYQNSCIYINIFNDRLEIENPGGLFAGYTVDQIATRSIRRNPLLADLLFRAGYGEKLGSGMTRIAESLQQNGNPSYDLSVTNFFSIRFWPRVEVKEISSLSKNQQRVCTVLAQAGVALTSRQIADQLGVSIPTVTRAVQLLIDKGLVKREGKGKSVRYQL